MSFTIEYYLTLYRIDDNTQIVKHSSIDCNQVNRFGKTNIRMEMGVMPIKLQIANRMNRKDPLTLVNNEPILFGNGLNNKVYTFSIGTMYDRYGISAYDMNGHTMILRLSPYANNVEFLVRQNGRIVELQNLLSHGTLLPTQHEYKIHDHYYLNFMLEGKTFVKIENSEPIDERGVAIEGHQLTDGVLYFNISETDSQKILELRDSSFYITYATTVIPIDSDGDEIADEIVTSDEQTLFSGEWANYADDAATERNVYVQNLETLHIQDQEKIAQLNAQIFDLKARIHKLIAGQPVLNDQESGTNNIHTNNNI